MCFEDLGLLNAITCLYDQKPVRLLPSVFLSTDRAPPIVAPFSLRDPPDVCFPQHFGTLLCFALTRRLRVGGRRRRQERL